MPTVRRQALGIVKNSSASMLEQQLTKTATTKQYQNDSVF